MHMICTIIECKSRIGKAGIEAIARLGGYIMSVKAKSSAEGLGLVAAIIIALLMSTIVLPVGRSSQNLSWRRKMQRQ
jgi:hypothetical protein